MGALSYKSSYVTYTRAFQRNIQGYAFWPLTMLLVFAMRFESLLHLRRHARKRGLDRAF